MNAMHSSLSLTRIKGLTSGGKQLFRIHQVLLFMHLKKWNDWSGIWFLRHQTGFFFPLVSFSIGKNPLLSVISCESLQRECNLILSLLFFLPQYLFVIRFRPSFKTYFFLNHFVSAAVSLFPSKREAWRRRKKLARCLFLERYLCVHLSSCFASMLVLFRL